MSIKHKKLRHKPKSPFRPLPKGNRGGVELLLVHSVDHVGKQGQVVEVKPGYAYNYLIPQGLATLEVIDEENIQQNALEVGTHLKAALHDLEDKHPLIGEVRGLGLMLGVELVRHRQTKEPANTEAADVMDKLKHRGVLIGKGGLFGNTLRIKPPMCLNKDDADFLVDCLDEILAEIPAKR